MEPNPYESPQAVQPLDRSRIVKRSVDFAAILLLTPPAMVIAVLACCSAQDALPGYELPIMFGIPLGILLGLMIGATLLWRPRKDDPNSTRRGIGGVLQATPFCVAVAMGAGFVLAALAYVAAGTAGGGMAAWGEWAILPAFWSPPGVTLLLMLWLAWRNR